MRFVCLTTSFNRKGLAVKSILSLIDAFDYAGLKDNYEIVFVDDGSVDGTTGAVVDLSDEVTVVPGNGQLFWAGGMRFGFDTIACKSFDYLIVFNDDVKFEKRSVLRLVKVLQVNSLTPDCLFTLTCSTLGADNRLSYGGLSRWSRFFPLSFDLVEPDPHNLKMVDVGNMNVAVIPIALINKIGFLASYFRHGGADYEYGIRASKHGATNYLAPGYFGWCERNSDVGTIYDKNLRFTSRLKISLSIKETPFSQTVRFYRDCAGAFWPLHLSVFYLSRLIRPYFRRRKIF